MQIRDLLRYPVKGLGPERLDTVALEVGQGLPLDRHFAITHGSSQFDFINPQWLPRRNFAVVARSPILASMQCQYDHASGALTLSANNETLLSTSVNKRGLNNELTDTLRKFIKDGQAGPYELVTVPDTSLTDSPTETLSLMNLRSLENLEHFVGMPLDPHRFRGNLWFEGKHAFEELDWVGKTIVIGDVKLRVTELIERCAAVDADPASGLRDIEVLKSLNKNCGHNIFGVLAEVLSAGDLTVGDEILFAPD